MSETDWTTPAHAESAPDAAETPQPESVTPEQPASDDNVEAKSPVEVGEEVTTPERPTDVEGVQVGGLTYVQNGDGTRSYPAQEQVDVEVKA